MSLAIATARTTSARTAPVYIEDIAVAAPATPQRAATCALRFDLIDTREEFDALEEPWNDLFQRAGASSQVFQTFNWNWHWANQYLGSSPGGIPGIKLCTLTAWRDGTLVMVWPLVSERVRGVTQIFWMGEPISQYGNVLIDDLPDALSILSEAWAYLHTHARADLMRLRKVREDARVAPLLHKIGASSSNPQRAPCLDLASAPTFEAYEQRYAAKARRNRRRQMRRLEEFGDVRFERFCGGRDARKAAELAIDLKRDWLQSRGLVSNAISDLRMRRFFADVAEAASHPVECIVSRLTANDEVAALNVSFACKDRLAVHVIAFSLALEKFSAGNLLMERCIRDALDEGFAIFDLMAPADDYKLNWSDRTMGVNDWSRPMSVKGYAYATLYLKALRGRIKTAMALMPKSLRRQLAHMPLRQIDGA